MKKIINNVFSIIAGLSMFVMLSCIIINFTSSAPFTFAWLKEFIISQLFLIIITVIVLTFTNLKDIANWLKDK